METNSSKPNLLELESLRGELISQAFDHPSDHLHISLFYNYFNKVLSTKNQNLIESFLLEFIEDYIYTIRRYEPCGVEPVFTEKLIKQLKLLKEISLTDNNLTVLNSEVDRIDKQFRQLKDFLAGKSYNQLNKHKTFFPLIDKESPDGFYGIIDSLTVRIGRSSESDKFIIIPSEKEIENRIAAQCKNSWQIAVNILRKYVKKPFKYHEVIISFDKKIGFYEGNSLGISLTLTFLEELLKFYNPQYIIKIKEQSAFTGGISEAGEVLNTGEGIIKQKVAAIFYSGIDSFVIPKLEETYAYFALTQLKEKYPERSLKLIPAEDFYDVLNRRDLVEIKKINPIVRTGKFVKRNWISAAATIILAVLFAYLFAVDRDDNPAYVEANGQFLNIKNANGKTLWKRHIEIGNTNQINPRYVSKYCRVIDINNDGLNEVLIANENLGKQGELNTQKQLICYDYKATPIWNFYFNELVTSNNENLDSIYNLYMIDILTVNNVKSLFLFANNGNSFSSVVFSIDLRTGNKIPGSIWCSGHTYDGLIKDLDGDSQKEIICMGLDNGFEDCTIFTYHPDTVDYIRPSTAEYTIKDFPVGNFISLIRIPKTDYDYAIGNRFYAMNLSSLDYISNTKEVYFFLDSDHSERIAGVWYKLNHNLIDFSIIVDNQFRVARDTLVTRGILNKPYSDTDDYKEIIKKNILYWNGNSWITSESIIKK